LVHTGKQERVYNLRVADYHTYFVGSEEWRFSVWAHNACDPRDLVKEATRLSKTRTDDTAFRRIVVESVGDASQLGGKTLFERLGITFGRKLSLDTPSSVTGSNRSYISYVFKNKQTGEVVYTGRASGEGTPAQVLQDRLNKPHKRYNPALHEAEVIDVHGSKLPSQGAEEVYMLGFRERGPLINDDPGLSYLTLKRARSSLSKLLAFIAEIASR
jgi:hypothetical protein